MADPHDPASDALIDLVHYEARMNPSGQLLHYAGGRIRTFWLRQTLTAFGALTIMTLASARLGVLLALLAITGEVFDLFCLRRVIQRLESAHESPLPRHLALTGAGVQALTIAACVTLVWRWIPLQEARFFASAVLISAVINAGLARPHFRQAADLRLSIFAATGFAMMALDLSHAELATSVPYGFFAADFALLAYISLLIIELSERNDQQRRRTEYTLLRQQRGRELAQDALAKAALNTQRLALVARYANDSIILCGADGKIAWVNDAFTRITGYAFDEAVGQFPADILNTPDTDPDTVARLAQARVDFTPVRAEILNRCKSGRLVWMETSIMPIFDPGGQLGLWAAVERDITEAKEREGELARARLAAEQADQLKSRFLANMSHEIRTPMNGVLGVADLLAETRLDPAQTAYLETILESGRLLLHIINDILDLAKLQSSKATLESLPFSPQDCIDAVLRILGPVAAKKGLALRSGPPPPRRMAVGDEGKLRQILLNLIGNAVKFTPHGAVTVTLRLTDPDLVEIEVADTGIGIAPDRISAIFDSFSQADNGISRQFGGTGLGLTICAMLAEQMGGKIDVRSDVGQGSWFTLTIRLALLAGDVAAIPRIERRARTRLRPGLRVLVAEDNRTNMMIVRKMLQDAVNTVAEAVNGTEALTLYHTHPPDLVLMDVSMPVKDGLQATRDIRALEAKLGWPRYPIVALTANAFGEDREACRLAGFDGFLVKPLSRADLLVEIDRHCPDLSPAVRVIGL